MSKDFTEDQCAKKPKNASLNFSAFPRLHSKWLEFLTLHQQIKAKNKGVVIQALFEYFVNSYWFLIKKNREHPNLFTDELLSEHARLLNDGLKASDRSYEEHLMNSEAIQNNFLIELKTLGFPVEDISPSGSETLNAEIEKYLRPLEEEKDSVTKFFDDDLDFVSVSQELYEEILKINIGKEEKLKLSSLYEAFMYSLFTKGILTKNFLDNEFDTITKDLQNVLEMEPQNSEGVIQSFFTKIKELEKGIEEKKEVVLDEEPEAEKNESDEGKENKTNFNPELTRVFLKLTDTLKEDYLKENWSTHKNSLWDNIQLNLVGCEKEIKERVLDLLHLCALPRSNYCFFTANYGFTESFKKMSELISENSDLIELLELSDKTDSESDESYQEKIQGELLTKLHSIDKFKATQKRTVENVKVNISKPNEPFNSEVNFEEHKPFLPFL